MLKLLLFVKIDPRHMNSMTFHSVLVNLRKKCALDCCTITNLNEFNHNSPIAQWIVECFSTQKMWVRVRLHLSVFFFSFFFSICLHS